MTQQPQVSVSRRKGFNPSHHKFYATKNIHNIPDITHVMLNDVWSPIVWKQGVRHRGNYISCRYLALDFDDGRWTIEKTKDWLANNAYAGIIGTSKSHQKEKKTAAGKVQEACDRFRLVIPFVETITDIDLYEYNMRQVMAAIPVDPSCKDGARYFFPCKEIVYAAGGGHFPCVNTKEDAGYIKEKQNEKAQNEKMKEMASSGLIPAWVLTTVMSGIGPYGRHKLCYRIGAQMTRCGFDTEMITNLIGTGPLSEIGMADVRRAVENGASAVYERK